MHQIHESLEVVSGRTGKDIIQLQNSRGIKVTEWEQGSKGYFKFLKKDSDHNWKPVVNVNALFHKCSIIQYY